MERERERWRERDIFSSPKEMSRRLQLKNHTSANPAGAPKSTWDPLEHVWDRPKLPKGIPRAHGPTLPRPHRDLRRREISAIS